MWSAGVQREIPFGFIVDATYVGRRGLYLQRERHINQLLQVCFTLTRGSTSPRFGRKRLQRHPVDGERRPLEVQQPAAQCRASLQDGLKVGLAYTLRKSEDNGSDKRNVLWNTYDDTIYWGPSSYDRRHALRIYYIYDLPF